MKYETDDCMIREVSTKNGLITIEVKLVKDGEISFDEYIQIGL